MAAPEFLMSVANRLERNDEKKKCKDLQAVAIKSFRKEILKSNPFFFFYFCDILQRFFYSQVNRFPNFARCSFLHELIFFREFIIVELCGYKVKAFLFDMC